MQRAEPVRIQVLVSEAAIEHLELRILYRASQLDEAQVNHPTLTAGHEPQPRELRRIVHDDRLRELPVLGERLQNPHNTQAR